jgi:hypothetical protein
MDGAANHDRQSPADAVAGLLAAAAMFTSLIAVAYRPVRVAPFAVLIALIAVGMSKRHERLGQLALAVSSASFVAGMILAVLTENPLF